MFNWRIVTRAEYDEGTKVAGDIYFLSDTKEIRRGADPFAIPVELYTTLPTDLALGRLYINSSTLEGKMYDGTTTQTVIRPIDTTVVQSSVNPVSGGAVMSYVEEVLENITGGDGLVTGITYDDAEATLSYTLGSGTQIDIVLDGLGFDLQYTSSTGLIQLLDKSGNQIGDGVNLDLERFVTSAEYDATRKVIILYFDNNTEDPLEDRDYVEIPVGDLVDIYTVSDTATVDMTMTDNNITAAVKISTEANNSLSAKADGLYVAPIPTGDFMTVVEDAVVGNVATYGADGQVVDSGVKAGGAALETTPVATTLATEAAVEAVRTALATSIANKMSKLDPTAAGKIVIVGSTGDSQSSDVAIGGAAVAATPTAGVVATEKAVVDYVAAEAVAQDNIVTAATVAPSTAAASDDKVVSESLFVGQLSWITNMD